MPDDVIFEILSWLPVKSACRFRCVSAGWDALITGPAFVAAHRARTEPILLFLAADTSHENNTRDLRLMDMDGNVVGVINRPGVCTYDYRLDGTVYIANDYLDVNSVINAIDLPTGAVTRISSRWNRESFWDLNVGCAAPSRTYKVVWLTRKDCKVLTLQDGAKWRHAQSPPELPTANSPSNSAAVTVDGVMHFLSGSMSPQVEEVSVLRFDLESEEWRASIKGPTKSDDDKLQRKTRTSCMVKLNNTLCMVQRTSTDVWLIWLLSDPTKGTWLRAYTIPMDSQVDPVMPLTVMHDGEKLLFYARNKFSATSTLQVYDPLTRKCTQRLEFASNLLGAGLCDLRLENFVSTKILPAAAPSVLSHPRFHQWLCGLEPFSLFYKWLFGGPNNNV
uniref:F-box domain-containing protein n=1 Tax=Hordeum vulgare subsp. vulgare TaxID=112509 RepID=A0A8I6YN82_HORVV